MAPPASAARLRTLPVPAPPPLLAQLSLALTLALALLVLLFPAPSHASGLAPTCPLSSDPCIPGGDTENIQSSGDALEVTFQASTRCCVDQCLGVQGAQFYSYSVDPTDPEQYNCTCYADCVNVEEGDYSKVNGNLGSCTGSGNPTAASAKSKAKFQAQHRPKGRLALEEGQEQEQGQGQGQGQRKGRALAIRKGGRSIRGKAVIGKAGALSGSLCPYSCQDCEATPYGPNFTDPLTQSMRLAFFSGVASPSTCTTLCQKEDAHYYQFSISDANRYQKGDCSCFSECTGALSNVLVDGLFFQGNLCNDGCTVLAPGTTQCPAYQIAVQQTGAIALADGVNTNYSYKACNYGYTWVSNVQLDCGSFYPLPTGLVCITPGCVVTGSIRPGKCKAFRFVHETANAFTIQAAPYLSPYPQSSVTVLSGLLGSSEVTLFPCTVAGYVRSPPRGPSYPQLAINYVCKVQNTALVPVWGVRMQCTNFDPLRLGGGLNVDCSISTRIPAQSFITISFITYPTSITMGIIAYVEAVPPPPPPPT